MLSVGEHDRVAIVARVVRIGRVEASRRGRRQPVERDVGRVEPDRRCETNDLPRRVTAEFRRIDGNVAAGLRRIFAQLHHVADRMLIRPLQRIEKEFDEVRVGVERPIEIVLQLVTTDMVDRLLAGTVLEQLPGSEQIERERLAAGRIRRRDVSWLGKHFGAIERRHRIRILARVVERAVIGRRIRIVLLIAQADDPSGKKSRARSCRRKASPSPRPHAPSARARRSAGLSFHKPVDVGALSYSSRCG